MCRNIAFPHSFSYLIWSSGAVTSRKAARNISLHIAIDCNMVSFHFNTL